MQDSSLSNTVEVMCFYLPSALPVVMLFLNYTLFRDSIFVDILKQYLLIKDMIQWQKKVVGLKKDTVFVLQKCIKVS